MSEPNPHIEQLKALGTIADYLLTRWSDHETRHTCAVVRGYRDLALLGDDVSIAPVADAVSRMREYVKQKRKENLVAKQLPADYDC